MLLAYIHYFASVRLKSDTDLDIIDNNPLKRIHKKT
jgi:hypothetical protein